MIVVYLFILLTGAARGQTAGEMLHACEMLQRGMHLEGDTVLLPPGPEASQCWGFMEAVEQYSTLADTNGKTFLNACAGENRSVSTVVRLFVEYARARPEKQGLPASALAYNAMADAFPCK
jgi:Rap1a immunity proteins